MKALLLGAVLGTAATAFGAERDPGLCAPGTVIGRIEVERVNVFDPGVQGETKRVFRWINAIHRPMLSRDHTIRSLLTIHEGMACTPEALEEAERALRSYKIFQDAWVEPIARDGNDVTIRVRTRDSWSTRLRLSFSSQGGANKTALRVQENNLFGSGKSLSWSRTSDQDRTESEFEYQDRALFGSRWRLNVTQAQSSDGSAHSYDLILPFWKFDSRYYADFNYADNRSVSKVYLFDPNEGNQIVDRWNRDSLSANAVFGLAPEGYHDGVVTRFYGGFVREQELWSPNRRDGKVFHPELAPISRRQTFAELRFDWLRPNFRRVSYFNSARRIDDIDLSTGVIVSSGIAIPSLSDERGGKVSLEANYGRGSDRHLQRYSARYDAVRADSQTIDAILEFEAQNWFKVSKLQTIYLRQLLSLGHGLQGTSRFLLGADTGLRGYSTRTFSGDNRMLLNFEHRFFAPWEFLHLFRAGLVGFAEAGAAWDRGQSFNLGVVHPDVGLGLRLELMRSSSGTTIQFNVGFPLDPNGEPGEGRHPVFSVLTSKGF